MSFSDRKTVVLIPSREEFVRLGLADKLWWSNADFVEAKTSAEEELIGALQQDDEHLLSSGEVVQLLYQPRCGGGHAILHALVASRDPRLRGALNHLLRRAHRKAGLHNLLLVQLASSADELLRKLDTCVSFACVCVDEALGEDMADLLHTVRRQSEACVAIVSQAGSSTCCLGGDFLWSPEDPAQLTSEWPEAVELSEALQTRHARGGGACDGADEDPAHANHGNGHCRQRVASVCGNDSDSACGEYEQDELAADEYTAIPRSLALLAETDLAFVVVDRAPPFPILHASARWVELTGFSAHEAEGRELAFMKGRHTDLRKLAQLKVAVECGSTCSAFLIGYDRTGCEFISYIRGVALLEPRDSFACVFERVGS